MELNKTLKVKVEGDLEIDVNIRGTVENPLYRATHIGTGWGLVNISSSIENFDDTEKVSLNASTNGGKQKISFLTKKGLLKFVEKSLKAKGKKFQKTGLFYEFIKKELGLAEPVFNICDYDMKSILYLLHLLGTTKYKFGESDDFIQRINVHKTTMNNEFKIVKCWILPNSTLTKKVEMKIKKYVKQEKIHTKHITKATSANRPQDVNSIEFFDLKNKPDDIDNMIKIIDLFVADAIFEDNELHKDLRITNLLNLQNSKNEYQKLLMELYKNDAILVNEHIERDRNDELQKHLREIAIRNSDIEKINTYHKIEKDKHTMKIEKDNNYINMQKVAMINTNNSSSSSSSSSLSTLMEKLKEISDEENLFEEIEEKTSPLITSQEPLITSQEPLITSQEPLITSQEPLITATLIEIKDGDEVICTSKTCKSKDRKFKTSYNPRSHKLYKRCSSCRDAGKIADAKRPPEHSKQQNKKKREVYKNNPISKATTLEKHRNIYWNDPEKARNAKNEQNKAKKLLKNKEENQEENQEP